MISSKDILSNKIKSIIIYTLRSVTLMCASGTLIQTFLGVLGLESRLIYIHSTLLQMTSVLSIMMCSRWADKGNIIKRSAFICIPSGLLFLLYIPACIINQASISIYALLIITSIVQAFVNGLSTVCEYKLPYYIYQNDDYGQVLSIGGVLSGVISLGIGIMISLLSEIFSYVNIMIVAFLVSALFMILAAVIGLSYKSLIPESENSEKKEEKIPLKEILKHKTFYKLFCPNLLRGISAGIVTVLATVAIDIGFDEGVTATMVSVQSAATLISCALFAMFVKKLPSKRIILIGSITFLLLPLLAVKNSTIFLTFYGIVFFGKILIDYAVPDMLFKIVPLEISGPYHAWRMVLNNGGIVLGTIVASILPVMVLLWFTAVSQLISGIIYVTTRIENRD